MKGKVIVCLWVYCTQECWIYHKKNLYTDVHSNIDMMNNKKQKTSKTKKKNIDQSQFGLNDYE